MFNFLNNIGPTELIIVALVIVIFFGAGIARRIGKASGETYKEIKNVKNTFTEAVSDEEKPEEK